MTVETSGGQFDGNGFAGHDLYFTCGDDGSDGGEGFFDREPIDRVFVPLVFDVADEDPIGSVGGGGPLDTQVAVTDRVIVPEQFFFRRVFKAQKGVERRAQSASAEGEDQLLGLFSGEFEGIFFAGGGDSAVSEVGERGPSTVLHQPSRY
jgi:hypothetical protein